VTDPEKKNVLFFKLMGVILFVGPVVCRFLVIANGLAAVYSLTQGLRCVVSMVRGSVLFNKGLAWAIFSCDQVSKRVKFDLFV